MKYIHLELSYLIGRFEQTMVQIYIYHAKSRLNTPVWGSLRSPNNVINFFFVIERTRDLNYLKFVATDFSLKTIRPSAGENSSDLA